MNQRSYFITVSSVFVAALIVIIVGSHVAPKASYAVIIPVSIGAWTVGLLVGLLISALVAYLEEW